MKRLLCFVSSLLICTSSVFAWNAESFVSDGLETYHPYELDPVEDYGLDTASVPMMFSMRSAGEVQSHLSWTDLVPLIYTNDKFGLYYSEFLPGWSITLPDGDISMPDMYVDGMYPESGLVPNVYKEADRVIWYTNTFQVPNRINGSDPSGYIDVLGTPIFYGSVDVGNLYMDVHFDLSSLGEFTCFELNGILDPDAYVMSGNTSLKVSEPSRISVHVNGNQYQDYVVTSGFVDFGSLIFDGSLPVTDFFIRINFPVESFDYTSAPVQANVGLTNSSTLSFSVLKDTEILQGFNDQAQDKINEHDALESQWSGSMIENFDALDIGSFSFPDGLIAALALLTGIFNDLWNGMGEYKVLYVFPLTLGVVLLLIGRISKFSGQKSSAKSGKDDGGA